MASLTSVDSSSCADSTRVLPFSSVVSLSCSSDPERRGRFLDTNMSMMVINVLCAHSTSAGSHNRPLTRRKKKGRSRPAALEARIQTRQKVDVSTGSLL